MGSSNDFATHTTLPSDSSPFREKYEIDEDGELLGEVKIMLEINHSYIKHYNSFIQSF